MGRISTLQKSSSVSWVSSRWFMLVLLSCYCFSVQSSVIKVTSSTPLVLKQVEQDYPAEALLDVGIVPLGVGLEFNADDETVLPAVRSAEGVYFANQLAKTIEQSGAWGAVRTVPSGDIIVDLLVTGIIKKSDGQTLDIDIEIRDSLGKLWLSKNYKQIVGKYAYDRRIRRVRDPFQNTFNRISNDILELRQAQSNEQASQLRTVSSVRFAQQFSPESFAQYLVENKSGQRELVRLPADSDTIYARSQKIRERDYLYIDTMQDYYDHFSQNMHEPYQNWRRASYDVVVKIDSYNSQGNKRILSGVLAIVAGIYGRYEGNNAYVSDMGTATAAVGGYLIKSGLEKKASKTKFIEDLSEMGASLEAEIEPQVIKLDDRTVTLSGTVEAQYEQWKTLLKKIYVTERGVVAETATEKPAIPAE